MQTLPPNTTTSATDAALIDAAVSAAVATATIPTHEDQCGEGIGKWVTTPPAQVRGSQEPEGVRKTMQSLTDSDRLKGCGVRPVQGAAEVSVAYAGGGHARFGGLQTCQSRWLCPVCARRIAGERARQVSDLVKAHTKRGGAVAMVTLTMPHFWTDSLEQVMDVTKKAWSKLTGSRAWRGIRARYGVTLAPIWALEVTHGTQGWHPHRHVLLLLDRALTPGALEAMRHEVHNIWARVVVKAGGRRPSDKQGVDVIQAADKDDAAALGGYVVKGDVLDDATGLADEVMRGATKKARRAGRTPFQILGDISAAYAAGEAPTPLDVRTWKTWEKYHLENVTRQVHVPKELEKLLEVDAVDEAAAADEDVVDGERLDWTAVVGIPIAAWRKQVAGDLVLRRAVLDAAAAARDALEARLAVIGVLEGAGVAYRVVDADMSRGPDVRAWKTDKSAARAVLSA